MTAPVDPRGAADFEATLRARVPGYLPGWEPTPGGAGAALLAIGARFDGIVADRLNRTPEKNELAFLDMLGVSLLPAQAARAPIAFVPRAGMGDSRVPAGTQIGATVPDLAGPLIFETEADMALAAARLVQVATVWPGQDQWADHTAAVNTHQPFTLFSGLTPIGHELYLGHDVLLALQGRSEVRVQFELAGSGARPLEVVWEYFDGDAWRAFADFVPAATASDTDSIDGTAGLTRSGTVVLRTDGAQTVRTRVNWIDSHWIRARAITPLTPDWAPHLPGITRVLLGSVVAPPIARLELNRRNPYAALKNFTVNASSVIAVCPDPTEAFVALSRPATDARPAEEIRHTVAGGGTQFGPFDAQQDGAWTLSMSAPGFTSAQIEVQLSATGAQDAVVVGGEPYPNLPDAGLADGLPLDFTKPFLPFGANPKPGSAFYLASAAAFTKPHATVTLVLEPARSGLTSDSGTVTALSPTLDAQYFDGHDWQLLDCSPTPELFTDGSFLQFEVPDDLRPVSVNGDERPWIRIRITNETFGVKRVTKISDSLSIETREVVPPLLASILLGYYSRSPMQAPLACHTRNDFTWVDASAAMPTRGSTLSPFTVCSDPTPALYLGFDRPLPTDLLSLYVDLEEVAGQENGPVLVWEAAEPPGWLPVATVDETGNLALPGAVRLAYPGVQPLPSGRGMQTSPTRVEFVDPQVAGRFHAGDIAWLGDDTEQVAVRVAGVDAGIVTLSSPTAKTYPRATLTRSGPARFGTPAAAWIRARLRTDGPPEQSHVLGLHPNTTWAAQVQSRAEEVLGTSDGNPGQSFSVKYPPVLTGERLEVLELSGARAAVDVATLTDDVVAHGGSPADLRLVTDRRTGAITQVWVRWQGQPNLTFSGPADRHYALERSHGLVLFGDDVHGRVPPALTDGLVLRSYRSGGGRVGNLPSGAINQLLSGVPAESVSNVRVAEGGADPESAAAVLRRGPASVAARGQALTVADYEVLAAEASPAVAVARALPATDAYGLPAPGQVRVVILPDSAEPRPVPSFGLRRLVETYLRRRSPASMAGRVFVTGPDYHPVGVHVELMPTDIDKAGPVAAAAAAAVRDFLHPLTGGPQGQGWGFGRDVYASDVARVLTGIDGVDFVRTLILLADDTPVGDVASVPPGRVVVAGDIRVSLAGGE